VKAHVTRRFSMPWSDPAGRMRDFVGAVRHIFGAFQGDHPMDYRSEHYQHTLLHPLFNPGPIEEPDIPIALGGVGPRLTALAGEVADGYMLHAFTNTTYQDKVTLPALTAGLQRAGRTRADIWVFGCPMYVEVLDAIGCADLQRDLESLVKQGRWSELAALVDDDILDHFVLRGTLEELPATIRRRYERYYDRAVPFVPLMDVEPDRLAQFVAAVMHE
jgi:alkanesulfonate monooxygenase SsuD/methylene tetrahydromethanopterin reductase-like flavin-dependent oxidoreductase (luciferase family)